MTNQSDMERYERTITGIELRAEGEARRATFVASDGSRDSYRTVLNVDGWDLKRFNRNGVIGYNHGISYSNDPDNIIGKGKAYLEGTGKDRKLMVDIEFEPAGINELADKVWAKLQFGSLNAVSVGFRPIGKGTFGKGEEGPGGANETYYYAGQELLEVSVVGIPANPNALKREEGEADELEALRKEALQACDDAPENPEDSSEELRLLAEKKIAEARVALL